MKPRSRVHYYTKKYGISESMVYQIGVSALDRMTDLAQRVIINAQRRHKKLREKRSAA